MFFYIFARCCLQFLKKTLITVIFWDNFWPLNLISPSEPVPYVNFTNSLSRFLVTSPGFLRDIYFSNFSYRMTEKLITLPKISELFISYRFFVLNWPPFSKVCLLIFVMAEHMIIWLLGPLKQLFSHEEVSFL